MNSFETKRPAVICLTPVRNEAWILDRFLKCASLWADHIIIADQSSSDGSREIASSYSKVTLLENLSVDFNEPEFRSMLLEAARLIPGQRLLISIDADEALTSNFLHSAEWETVLHSSPGTLIKFQWANLRPDLRSYWTPPGSCHSWGFMDDGSEYVTSKIHGRRLPEPDDSPSIVLNDIKVLHYQYTDWQRMQSKHRWYQCWERLNQSERRATQIYRQYHHMYAIPQSEIHPLPKEWISGYEQQGIDMTSIRRESVYRWDKEVLDLFDKHGSETFRKEAIWDFNWADASKKLNFDNSSNNLDDPRNFLERSIHSWLRASQPDHNKLQVKFIDKLLLKLLGW